MRRAPEKPPQRWARFGARQVFLGILGLPGDDVLPERGWLRWAAIAFLVVLAIVVVAIIVLS
jgi:hypothetical protein